MTKIEGKKAPDFELEDQDGKSNSLKMYKGKYVLLYFYPKDNTPGCTIEAKRFRDHLEELTALGVVVLGVSADSKDSHKGFCEKHSLNFHLLSDGDKEVIKKYGVWVEKSMFGKKYMGIQRDSFLISPDGIIVKHYKKVKPMSHVNEVISDLKSI